jgi:predicted RNase H-like nuclease
MRVAGADVWKGRWIVVVLADGRFERALIASTIDSALDDVTDVVAIGVDMPIGLPEKGQKRSADDEARAYVGPRRSSVFSTPSRDLLEAASHSKANELARADGRLGITVQSYGLGPLIFQVEPVARRDSRLYEVHPEVSFAAANGDAHLPWSKTSWNGIKLRCRILESQGIVIPDDLGPSGGAGVADVLDAGIAAWSANRIAAGTAERMPLGQERGWAIWR